LAFPWGLELLEFPLQVVLQGFQAELLVPLELQVLLEVSWAPSLEALLQRGDDTDLSQPVDRIRLEVDLGQVWQPQPK
jgi:hypothetical protein